MEAPAAIANRGPAPFRYEEMWTRHPEYDQMVAEAWCKADDEERGANGTCSRLRRMTADMQRWGREVFGSVHKQIAKLKAQLTEAKERALHTGYNQELWELEEQLRELYEREEIMTKQRSRVDWLQAGDQNTRYFQNRASHRKRKNTVRSLLREDGSRCSVDEEMRALAAGFYANLFASEGS